MDTKWSEENFEINGLIKNDYYCWAGPTELLVLGIITFFCSWAAVSEKLFGIGAPLHDIQNLNLSRGGGVPRRFNDS